MNMPLQNHLLQNHMAGQIAKDIAALRAQGVSNLEARVAVIWPYLRRIECGGFAALTGPDNPGDSGKVPSKALPRVALVKWTERSVPRHAGVSMSGHRVDALRKAAGGGFHKRLLVEMGMGDATATNTITKLNLMGLVVVSGKRKCGRGQHRRLRKIYRATPLGRRVLAAIDAGPDAPTVWVAQS